MAKALAIMLCIYVHFIIDTLQHYIQALALLNVDLILKFNDSLGLNLRIHASYIQA